MANPLVLYNIADTAVHYLKKILIIGLISSTVIALLAMYGSFIIAFAYMYDLIQTFINTYNSSSGNIVCYLYGLLNCMGFVSAFNDTKSIFLSGIVFLMARILYVNTYGIYIILFKLINPILLSK